MIKSISLYVVECWWDRCSCSDDEDSRDENVHECVGVYTWRDWILERSYTWQGESDFHDLIIKWKKQNWNDSNMWKGGAWMHHADMCEVGLMKL